MASDRTALYFRMSDDRQENSIERQRSEVLPFAQKHGLAVVREYLDPGVTGSEIAKRKQFQRMLRDAQAGAFDVILCDDKDRFGRFDSIDSGEVIAPLRRAGVRLVTVAQGAIDWESFSGRITDAVLQEAKRMEQEAISRRVLSGQLLKAQRGEDTGGRPLYGYRLEFRRDGSKRRVPDGRRAEVVKLIFRLYDQGNTLCGVADELYRRGVASPHGKARWTRPVIQRILLNRRYVGDFTWGVRSSGKCHRYARKDGYSKTTRGARTQQVNPSEEWIVRPDAWEPLVDRETFERVQARLKGNRDATTPHRNGGDFLLSRLLVCGHCGCSLVGVKVGPTTRQYICRGYMAHGKGFCNRNSIHEYVALKTILAKLKAAYLDPDNLKTLRTEVAVLEAEQQSDANLRRLRGRVDDLTRKIDQGNENLLILPADRLPGAAAKLREFEAQRQTAQEELRRAETESPVERLEERIRQAEEALWTIHEALDAEDWPLMRRVLRDMLVKVVFFWKHEQRGNATFSRLHRGELYPQTDEGVSELSPPAGR
jgi:DNA invertase Pin-like site-specific DNA recombinase